MSDFISKESFVEGFGAEAQPQRAPAKEAPPESGPYDPTPHTVAEVQQYVTQNPDQRAAVAEAERAGRNRTTLLDWLSA
jgi:hypothetical protein